MAPLWLFSPGLACMSPSWFSHDVLEVLPTGGRRKCWPCLGQAVGCSAVPRSLWPLLHLAVRSVEEQGVGGCWSPPVQSGLSCPSILKEKVPLYRALVTDLWHSLVSLRAPQEKRVRWASVATLGPLVLLVNRASQALLEKKGQR